MTSFRLHLGQTLLDFPLRTYPEATITAATIWPETRAPSGWAWRYWEPGPTGRGFQPAMLDLGDIIQFGAQHPPHQNTFWFGYLHAVRPDSVLIHGPHPTPADALAAAQQALVQQIHAGRSPGLDSRRSPVGTELPGADPATVAMTPAQPPVTTSVSFNGNQATVGDPVHGWLVVDTASLMAAMPYPTGQLSDLLRDRGQWLDGREPALTMAGLAARHYPHGLPPAIAPAPPTIPAASQPDPAVPSPAPPKTANEAPSAPTSTTQWAPPDAGASFPDASL